MPVPYFHVVFTLPPAIADIAYQNKAVVYDLLFRAAAETVLTIAADPKHLGARIGITAVLHTWGSTMTHHPHVHMIVPGGGISLDGSRWLSCRPRFFLPVPVFSKLFRGLMLGKLLAAHKAGQLKFFGQHAHLAAIRASSSTSCRRASTHYGLFAKASCADNIARARELLAGPKPQREPADADVTAPNHPSTPCPCCGGRMIIIETFARNCPPHYQPSTTTVATRIDTS